MRPSDSISRYACEPISSSSSRLRLEREHDVRAAEADDAAGQALADIEAGRLTFNELRQRMTPAEVSAPDRRRLSSCRRAGPLGE